MSLRKVPFALDEHYHLYNRGNSKQKIFFDVSDYRHFVKLLYICNSERNFKLRDITENNFEFDRVNPIVSIGAFCLMPNHFHILVNEVKEGGISKFMQKLSTAYVMYVNTKYERTGSLFEGKFKSRHIDTDRYLRYVFSYIHLNPIKLIHSSWKGDTISYSQKVNDYLAGYEYSSYKDYAGEERVQSKILSKGDFPDYFPTPDSFKAEMKEWIQFKAVTPQALPVG